MRRFITIAAVRFQRDGTARQDTLLQYRRTLPNLTSVSQCIRVNLQQSRQYNNIFSYAVPDDSNELVFSVQFGDDTFYLACCGGNVELEVPLPTPLRQWIPVCFVLDLLHRSIRLLVEGKVKEHRLATLAESPLAVRGGGLLVLGQDQDSYGGGYIESQSFSGILVDLLLFDRLLSDDDLIAFSECRTMTTTALPIVSFSNVEQDFEAVNAEVERIGKQDFCETHRKDILIFPELRPFEEAKRLCNISGGELEVPESKEQGWLLFNKCIPYAKFCNTGSMTNFWLGVKGNVTTQTWNHYVTGKVLTYTDSTLKKFTIEEPATCVAFIGDNNTNVNQHANWNSVDCQEERCPLCYLDEVVLLKARGLCSESLFDRDYFLTNDNGAVTFTGVYYSMITRYFTSQGNDTGESDYGYWVLSRLDKPSVRATLQMDSPTHYPLGRQEWVVDNDVCGVDSMVIMMTVCKEHQFSCDDGNCVRIQQRCDMEVDCPDGSDEMGCDFLTLDLSYNSDNPPPRLDVTKPVEIKLQVDIFAIRKIDVANFRFTCEIEITMEWFDSRLRFRHLNYASELNSLTGLERQPWRPKLEFLGDRNTASDVQERRVTLSVRRYTTPLRDNDEEVLESEIFEGGENGLLMVQKLTVTTPCQFSLEMFPFDQQVCHLRMSLTGVTNQYVKVHPGEKGIAFRGRRRLLEYQLVREGMVQHDQGNYSGVEVQLYLRNLSNFYITSTYVPTFIIVVIGYLVYFFPLANFNERVLVGLTGLLVEATFFSQVNSSIPHTAYMKLVDIWMVFCILTLFLVVVSVVAIQCIQDSPTVIPYKPRKPKLVLKQSWSTKPDAWRSSCWNLSSMWYRWRSRWLSGSRAVQLNRCCLMIVPLGSLVFLAVYAIMASDRVF
ncbi:uncharacterized protein LOC134776483 [Penaeus indicus]|uniref:uncharacterized protein LOC134776483 n=1 Tax=Penaeus indicus TaxID=29960 RepID=UPI00300CC597